MKRPPWTAQRKLIVRNPGASHLGGCVVLTRARRQGDWTGHHLGPVVDTGLRHGAQRTDHRHRPPRRRAHRLRRRPTRQVAATAGYVGEQARRELSAASTHAMRRADTRGSTRRGGHVVGRCADVLRRSRHEHERHPGRVQPGRSKLAGTPARSTCLLIVGFNHRRRDPSPIGNLAAVLTSPLTDRCIAVAVRRRA